jgi:hypothetical protein
MRFFRAAGRAGPGSTLRCGDASRASRSGSLSVRSIEPNLKMQDRGGCEAGLL